MSSKAILPVLWELNPGHPNLLPCFYDQSKARKELLGCGAQEVVLPKLNAELVFILQQQSMTIDRALDSNRLFVIDRQRLVDYRKSIFSQFDANSRILLS